MAALDRIVAASADTRGGEAGTASRGAKDAGARATEGALSERAATKTEPGASEGAPFVGSADVTGEPLPLDDGAASRPSTGAEQRIQAEPERQRERTPAEQMRARSAHDLGGQRVGGQRVGGQGIVGLGEADPRLQTEPARPTRSPLRRVAEPQVPPPAVPARPARAEQPLATAQPPGALRPRADVREIVRERVIERSIVERLHTVREVPVSASGSLGSTRNPDTERGHLARASVPLGPLGEHVAKPEAATPRQPSPRVPVRPQLGPFREGNTEQQLRAPVPAPVPAAREPNKPSGLRGDVARPATPSDARRGADRDVQRPRSAPVNAATRPAPAPLARAAAVVPAPRRAEVLPQPPKEAQARLASPGGAGHPRQRAGQAPHLAAPPRVHISIGRVEIRGKESPSPLVRSAVSAPRSHEIDPGLPFGSFGGGRP